MASTAWPSAVNAPRTASEIAASSSTTRMRRDHLLGIGLVVRCRGCAASLTFADQPEYGMRVACCRTRRRGISTASRWAVIRRSRVYLRPRSRGLGLPGFDVALLGSLAIRGVTFPCTASTAVASSERDGDGPRERLGGSQD